MSQNSFINLVINNEPLDKIVDLFVNDKLIYDYDLTKTCKKCILAIYKSNICYREKNKEILRFIKQNIENAQFNLVDKLLMMYFTEKNKGLSSKLTTQVENKLLEFILNLYIDYYGIVPIKYENIFLKLFYLNNIIITENIFYNLYFIKYITFGDYQIKNFKNNLNYNTQHNYLKKSELDYDLNELNITKLFPNNFKNVHLMIKYVIFYEGKNEDLFNLIKDKLNLVNDDIIYEILNSNLMEYKISIKIIKYLLYVYKFKLDPNRIKLLNQEYELNLFGEVIENYKPNICKVDGSYCYPGHKSI